ncbi:phosphopantetheine-binding protein [Pseudomonas sp. MS646]|uniref:phosphopantetheine-binding protein n=1 Tax=Pseudomonas sp. MS646 TaxID=3118751 RepID=UPI0030D0A982
MVSSLERVEIEREVIEILSGSLMQSDRLIGSDSQLVKDLYVDSIVLIEMILELNERFGIELFEAEVAEWKTVREICRSVESCIVQKF